VISDNSHALPHSDRSGWFHLELSQYCYTLDIISIVLRMHRTACVLCDSDKLSECFTIKNYPITSSSDTLAAESDEFNDCEIGSCLECGTLQLLTLVDPIKLYKNSHNSTENTPTWKEHHRLFADFVADGSTATDILEIGGNSGVLYKFLCDKFPKYSILDICDSKNRPPDVRFIEGNCEAFDFTGLTHLVLSHTFEHLYSPAKFVENLANAGIQSVCISIPNMEQLYKSRNISILHNEHTYFVAENEIKYLFSIFGYACKRLMQFKKHSTFYEFTPARCELLPILKNTVKADDICKVFSDFESSIQGVTIDKSCFICPAGHYGQKLYYYLRRFRNYILGFIDNDVSKQGLRVYGTDAYVFSPNILTKYQDTSISIVLYAGPYIDELKLQLSSIHPSIEYIAL
jgi:hypothetical protein